MDKLALLVRSGGNELAPMLFNFASISKIANEYVFSHNTVKLARAKLPANAGNFACSSQVKRPHTQFTCVTSSLPVKIGEFSCVDAASTSRRKHACLQAHVSLPEYHGYFTGNFTCRTNGNLRASSMQNCLLLLATKHAICRQKH